MAENSNDIWKRLRDYNIEPPVNTFKKVWEIIVRQKLSADNPTPTETNSPEAVERAIFSSLQQYSITPPTLQIESIKHPEAATSPKKYNNLYRLLVRAAVILFVIGAGTFFYFSVKHQKVLDSAVRNTPAQKVPGNLDQSVHHPVRDSALPALTAVAPATNGKKTQLKNVSRAPDLGRKFKTIAGLTDQVDQLLTLANYQDPAMKKFSNKISKERRIVFSQYSYINLSDEMIKMINEVYLKKPNGKPSRAAKKTEKKFKKWKKQDEKYFDKGKKKNPADIIDLSEFLLKN